MNGDWKSVVGIATHYRLDSRGSNPGGARDSLFSIPVQTGHSTTGIGTLSRGQSGPGVALTTRPI